MTEHKKVANAAAAIGEYTTMLDEATPPVSPAPMPPQTLVFWTPRLALASALRAVTDLRRPEHAVQRAIASVPNADDPR
jgi:hypothetical protein